MTDRNRQTDRGSGSRTQKGGARILPFRREATLSLGFVVFLFILLYLVFSLVRSLTRETYSTFTVGREEGMNGSRSYHALILRQEKTVNSRWAGYVDIFAPETSHVSVGSVVSSVDEIGTYSESIREAAGLQSLDNEDLRNLKTRLKRLSSSYSGAAFSAVYESKNAISSFFMSNVGSASLAVLEENASLNEFFHVHKSDTSGLVLYYKDGYEEKKPTEIKGADFTAADYDRDVTESLVSVGDFLYKLVDSENWTLVVPLSTDEAALYGQESSITFTFLKNGLEASAGSRVINGADGSYLLELSLSRYMVRFASDRFTEIRIDSMGGTGYKIPKSCQVTENMFLIPREYELEDNAGFLEEIYSGTVRTAQLITPTVSWRDEKYCYVDTQSLKAETVLIKPESQDRYTVRLTASLTGVYQINAGFTVFCPIEVLEENGEYLLVKKGSAMSIATYDKLLLNGSKYRAGQILR